MKKNSLLLYSYDLGSYKNRTTNFKTHAKILQDYIIRLNFFKILYARAEQAMKKTNA